MRVGFWNLQACKNDMIAPIQELSKRCDLLIFSDYLPYRGSRVNNRRDFIQRVSSQTSFDLVQGGKGDWLTVFLNPHSSVELHHNNGFDKEFFYDEIVTHEQKESEAFAEYLQRQERMVSFQMKLNGKEILLILIHFPSKLYLSSSKQRERANDFANWARTQILHCNSPAIVMGDFNMSPFEEGMVNRKGFAAMPFSIPVQGDFYNPVWNLMGDIAVEQGQLAKSPAGSFYTDRSQEIDYFWYSFDQVLLTHDAISFFEESSLKYLTKLGKFSLIKDDYTPNKTTFSDHLPLVFKLNL